MLEKEIVDLNLEQLNENHKKAPLNYKEQPNLKKRIIFEDLIRLINEKRTYMLGPEKTATARFIANHFIDVYSYLKNKIEEL